jgi:hypothetical protein
VKQSLDSLNASGPLSCIIVGIESHICVTQTTLDLLRAGHTVYVIADGVSSCNKEEVPIALARLRHEGAVVTTSESFMYEYVGDAGTAEYVLAQPPDLRKCGIGIPREVYARLADTVQVQGDY